MLPEAYIPVAPAHRLVQTIDFKANCRGRMTVMNGASAQTAPGSEPGRSRPPVEDADELAAPASAAAFAGSFTASPPTRTPRRGAAAKGVAAEGATPIKRCTAGSKTCVIGTIRSITLQPVTGTPALHADLWDGSGSIRLIWLGRRQIPGIDPGRELLVEGRIIEEHGHSTIYNPRYELRNGQDAAAR